MNKNDHQLKNRIVSFLEKQPNNKFKARRIARALKISTREYPRFRNFLKTLSQDGVITRAGGTSYRFSTTPSLVIGRLKVKSQGYGFVRLEREEQEVFISQRNMGNALDGDLVAVQRFAQSRRGLLPEGRIDHVVERKRQYIVGTYKQGKYFNFVAPDDLKIPWDIIVHDTYAGGAKPGQKVAVTIDYWEDYGLNPSGKIDAVLGYPEEQGVDITAVMYSFNLPLAFPEEVEEEAQMLPRSIRQQDLAGRLDLRDLACFTIDPEDAKDYDDAVSLQIQRDGSCLLGVHIADVSHYVPEGSRIDQEALQRGTSVYLVDRVIPMLPEILSTQVCSLKPHQDRLTFSVLMTLDRHGELLRYQIRPSVIRSKRRFSYREAAAILESGEGEFVEVLTSMRDLSQILYRQRLDTGSLDFETPEARIELDDSGFPIAVHRQKRLITHQIIEEFMLLANRVVAEHIALRVPARNRLKKKWPFIYRIHERPDAKKIADFASLVRTLGYQFPERKRIHSRHLLEVLRQVEGRPEEDIVNQVMLRSLMKAKYHTRNVGHFGLAFPNYTHFTSPIRRYPDLVVHRLLKEYATVPSPERISHWRQKLPEICRIASEQEINAQEAERKSVKMKQAEFMLDKLGEEYDGIISGIVAFGIFVEIVDYLVEGLVPIKYLTSDYYLFDEANFRLIGKTTGNVYRLGDRVKVKVIRVVPEEQIIDFQLIENPAIRKAKKKRTTPRGKKNS